MQISRSRSPWYFSSFLILDWSPTPWLCGSSLASGGVRWPPCLLSGIDDLHKLGLQRSTSHQETINVGLLGQLLGIGSGDRATVLDAQAVGDILGDVVAQPLAQEGVNFLGLKKKWTM